MTVICLVSAVPATTLAAVRGNATSTTRSAGPVEPEVGGDTSVTTASVAITSGGGGVRARGGAPAGQHVHHITGPDELDQRIVGEVQGDDPGIRSRGGLGQARSEQTYIGEYFPAPGRPGQRGVHRGRDIGVRTVGNGCRRTLFDLDVGRCEGGSRCQVTGRDQDGPHGDVRVGSQRRDGSQQHQQAGRYPTGRHGSGPTRAQAMPQPRPQRRIQ